MDNGYLPPMGRIGIALGSIATLAVVVASGFTVYAQKAALEFRSSHFYVGDPRPAYASFATHEVRTKNDWHGFEDWNKVLVADGPPQGYASVDAKPTLQNSVPQDHLVGIQSRPIYDGTADLTGYFHAVNATLQHTGEGVVSSGHGVHIYNPRGTGQIDELVGLYIENQTKGERNAGIVSHNSVNYLSGVQTDRIDVGEMLVLPRMSIAELLTIEGPEGAMTFGNDACKPAQAPPDCDGAPVYWSHGDWRTLHDGKPVIAADIMLEQR